MNLQACKEIDKYRSIGSIAGSIVACFFLLTPAAEGAWTHQTIDDVGDTGWDISLEAANPEALYISYRENDERALRFARSTDGGGTWSVATIDDQGDVDADTSLAAVDSNLLYMSYAYFFEGALRFAKSIDGGLSWGTQTLEQGGEIGSFGSYNSLAAPDADTIFVSYNEVVSEGPIGWSELKLAKSTDGGENWTLTTVHSGSDRGAYNSIAAVDASTLFISYEKKDGNDLNCAVSNDGGATFALETADADDTPGYWSSIDAVDADHVFISHQDVAGDDLRLTKSSDGGLTWATSIVDSVGNVGKASSLYAHDANHLYITYQDTTNLSLKLAESSDGGETWLLSTIDDSARSQGLFSSVHATEDGTVYVAYSQTQPGQPFRYQLNLAIRTPGPTLAVSGACPGDLSISVSGAAGNAAVALLGSASEGASLVPAGRPCEGLPLELDEPSLLTTFVADPLGNQTIERTIGEGACGLYLQAVDLSTCGATSVGQVPVQ